MTSSSTTIGSLSEAFEAARRTGANGYWWFPSLDVNQQMPEQTREQITKKSWWLYNNVDAVAVIIDGLSLDEVDKGLWPKFTTSNPAFNKLATDVFHDECGDPRLFHSGGRETYYSAQILIRRSIRLAGELFCQFLSPSLGYSSLPMCHFINSWQIGNLSESAGMPDQSRWNEGIMSDKFGAAQQYRVLLNAERTEKLDVSASDMLHLHDKFWNGQRRGIGCLAPVAQQLFSFNDLSNRSINGMLMREQMAYALIRSGDAGNDVPIIPGATEVQKVDNGDGTTTSIQKIVTRDAGEMTVANMPSGWDMKVVESQRATTTPEYLRAMLFRIALPTLYPPDYVYSLAGLTQGTLVRMVQRRVQRVKDAVRTFNLNDQFCKRWTVFWTWQRIKAGRFDGVEGGIPDDWYRHKQVFPADDTVDLAREGRMYDERLHNGDMSPSDYHGLSGRDDEDVEDEVNASKVRKAKKICALLEIGVDSDEYKKILRSLLMPEPLAPVAQDTAPTPALEPEPEPEPKKK